VPHHNSHNSPAIASYLHLADKLHDAEAKLANYERKSEQITEMLEEALANGK